MNYQVFRSSIPSISSLLKGLLPTYKLKELIIQSVIKICERFPLEFDETIFKQIDLLFVLTSDEFKEQRSKQHLIGVIFSLFLIQRSLRESVTLFGEKRHFQFRLTQTLIKFPFGSKTVLSFIGGICLFDEQETFEEKHILLAAQKFIAELQIVKGTALLHRDAEANIQLVYVEFEKKGGGSFSCEEIARLKTGASN